MSSSQSRPIYCNAIYKSGPKAGKNCANLAKWLKSENGILIRVCGVHSKRNNRIPYHIDSARSLSPSLSTFSFSSLPPARSFFHEMHETPVINSIVPTVGRDVRQIVAELPKIRIGSGSHSVVYSITLNGRPRALKIFKSDFEITTLARREVYALKILDSPYIIKPDYADQYGLVLPLGTPLRKISKALSRRNDTVYVGSYQNESGPFSSITNMVALPKEDLILLLSAYRDVTKALSYLHSMRMVHMDIKPGNVVLFPSDNGSYTAKLIDFGGCLSMLQQDAPRKTYTTAYASPELLLRKGCCVSPAQDIWSLGVMMYAVARGHHPYRHLATSRTSDVPKRSFRVPLPGGESIQELSGKAKKLPLEEKGFRFQKLCFRTELKLAYGQLDDEVSLDSIRGINSEHFNLSETIEIEALRPALGSLLLLMLAWDPNYRISSDQTCHEIDSLLSNCI